MEKNISTEIPVPLPTDWINIHSQLSDAWVRRNDIQVTKPPVPLILAGAAFSSASDIRSRWIDLINWANEYGFSAILLNSLPEPPDLDVAESIAGVSTEGKGWWPEIGEQFHKPKHKPSKKTILATLQRLKIE